MQRGVGAGRGGDLSLGGGGGVFLPSVWRRISKDPLSDMPRSFACVVHSGGTTLLRSTATESGAPTLLHATV